LTTGDSEPATVAKKAVSQEDASKTSGATAIEVATEPQQLPASPVPPPASAQKYFEYSVPGLPEYSFRYKPGTELVFGYRTDQDDLRLRFRSALIPDGGDFVVRNKRLITEDGLETPFDVTVESHSICFLIRESGVSLVFPFKP
jgi:hypothetical protein